MENDIPLVLIGLAFFALLAYFALNRSIDPPPSTEVVNLERDKQGRLETVVTTTR